MIDRYKLRCLRKIFWSFLATIGLLPKGGRQATACQKKQSAANSSFAPLLFVDKIDYQKVSNWAPWAPIFTTLVQGLRATKTAVSVGVVLYRKWRYQPSQWRHCFPLAMALDLLLSACIGCQLAFYLRPIITINYSSAEGKEVRQPCLP